MLAMWEVYRRTGDCGALDKLQATLQVRTSLCKSPAVDGRAQCLGYG
jgi:hypothetical protein